MATAEPTHADDADPGSPGSGPRIPLPARTQLDESPTRDNESRTQDSEPPAHSDESRTHNGAHNEAQNDAHGDTHNDAHDETSSTRQNPLTRLLLRHPIILATALAGVLHVVWFFTFANSGGDLAAQDAWAEFVGQHPDSAYNLAWYGGMHPVSYSVVSPYLMSVLGVRTTMMIAGTISAGLLTLILIRSKAVRQPLWPALAGVFALLCNAASGRVTYGLGMVFALAAAAVVFCWPHRWRYKRWAKALCAAPLAALATASSPVAGLFVGLVAVALFLQKRRPGAYALGIAPTVVVALSAWLFPFSGTQPMAIGSASLPFLSAVAVYLLVPKEWKTVRITAAVYGLSVLLVWLISSQIGSNITRLAMLFAGVVLLAALPYTVPRSRKWYAIVLAFAGFTGWIGFKSVDDVVHTTPAASWARELAPLVNQLQVVGAEKGRVEVVPARSHREASALAPYVNLARGWNRQADMERNPLFYDDTLNSANYHEWLQRWAVHYVVVPKGEPDGDGAERERELVQRGMPYLEQIWGDANWQLFAVTDPASLAEPNAVVERAEQGEMTLQVKKAGRILIRIPYSPWLSVVDADGKSLKAPQETEASKDRADDDDTPKTYDNINGCLMQAEENASGDKWTELLAPTPGTYRLAAPYQLPRGTPCPEELR
ncbi:MFS transporter [Streptomyces sp. NBC_00564]|uniref:MFS transporter n=1 Tax=Streptomyces sp. NBC_00564 TaxID=2903663 RepID=UPI00352D8265|nr:DMT family transporter [Streptomyces sp. NBC_00564]